MEFVWIQLVVSTVNVILDMFMTKHPTNVLTKMSVLKTILAQAQWSKINNPIRKFKYFRVYQYRNSWDFLIRNSKSYTYLEVCRKLIVHIILLSYTFYKCFSRISEWNSKFWITVKAMLNVSTLLEHLNVLALMVTNWNILDVVVKTLMNALKEVIQFAR